MWAKIKNVLCIILLVLIIISVYIIVNDNKNCEEIKTEKIAVNKITCYTSANAVDSKETIKSDWELDIYQYTDIAIYLQKITDINIKTIYIDNMQIIKQPKLGEAEIYRKNLQDFAKSMLLEGKEDKIEYSVTLDGINDFQQNCTNPITISYINKNIKKEFVVPNTSNQLFFDETILKKALILSEDIEAQIMFDINVVDTEEKQYKASVVLDIPIEELMDGKKSVEINEYIVFEEV